MKTSLFEYFINSVDLQNSNCLPIINFLMYHYKNGEKVNIEEKVPLFIPFIHSQQK